MELALAAKIEALLFWKSEPLTVAQIAQLGNATTQEVEDSLRTLAESLANHGLRLVRAGEDVTLGTAPELGEWIQQLTKEELGKELGKAGLETLTTVLYSAPATRAEIDYIRGVNSSFILRHLLMRGLITREVNPTDSRSYIYKPSLDLLAALGVTEVSALPGFDETKQKLAVFKTQENE